MNQELQMLKYATKEIEQLRVENKVMGARLNMFDNIMMLLSIEPQRNGMMCSPDVVHDLKKHIDNLESKEKAAQ